MEPTGIGVIGVGDISGAYLGALRTFPDVRVLACAARHLEHARRRAKEWGIPRACTPEELLADAGVQIVLDLTVPLAHAQVARAALEAGKHVYNEKPLATTRADGRALLELAAERGLRLGCAPDTFLGAGLQTCRQLLDEGAIGRPVAANACVMLHGHEHWHPNPAFYYQAGGGPMLDLGPYYLTALVALLGPVRRVAGMTRTSFPERVVTSQPLHGTRIPVDVPTHVAGLLELAVGPFATIVTSFDVWAKEVPLLEIHGSEGTLSLPDPNTFGGPVRLRRFDEPGFRHVPLSHGYAANMRGLGVADMAAAIQRGRPHRCSAQLAYHVLDIMQALHEASSSGELVTLQSACARPAALPAGAAEGLIAD